MRKTVVIMAVCALIGSSAFAVDFSIGANFGYGLGVLRGKDALDVAEDLEKAYGSAAESMALKGGVDLLAEINPLFAIETGVGFDGSSVGHFSSDLDTNILIMEISIPVLARIQKEYGSGFLGGVTYLAAGFQLGIPVGEPYYSIYDNKSKDTTDLMDASVSFDIPVAVGQELRLGESNYIGLRFQYNFNIIAPFDKDGQDISWNHDYFTVDLTYRFKF